MTSDLARELTPGLPNAPKGHAHPATARRSAGPNRPLLKVDASLGSRCIKR